MEGEQKLLICELSFDRMDIERDDVNFEHIESFTLTYDVITTALRCMPPPQCGRIGRSRAMPAARRQVETRFLAFCQDCTHEAGTSQNVHAL